MTEQLSPKDGSLLIQRAYRAAIRDISKKNWPKVTLDVVYEFVAVGLLPIDIGMQAFGKIVKKAHSRNITPPSP